MEKHGTPPSKEIARWCVQGVGACVYVAHSKGLQFKSREWFF